MRQDTLVRNVEGVGEMIVSETYQMYGEYVFVVACVCSIAVDIWLIGILLHAFITDTTAMTPDLITALIPTIDSTWLEIVDVVMIMVFGAVLAMASLFLWPIVMFTAVMLLLRFAYRERNSIVLRKAKPLKLGEGDRDA